MSCQTSSHSKWVSNKPGRCGHVAVTDGVSGNRNSTVLYPGCLHDPLCIITSLYKRSGDRVPSLPSCDFQTMGLNQLKFEGMHCWLSHTWSVVKSTVWSSVIYWPNVVRKNQPLEVWDYNGVSRYGTTFPSSVPGQADAP